MLRRRLAVSAAIAVAGSLALATKAPAQQGPPPLPTAANGATVERVATGVSVPTSFAFAPDGTVFAGSGPGEGSDARTGLFTIADGAAKRVPGTPRHVFGLAWRNGRLFVSTGSRIISLRGWDGTRFEGRRVVRRAGKQLPGFNGIAFGPNGRLYAGVSLADMRRYDAVRGPGRYANSVVSMRATGADLRIVARGLRQPFGLTFPEGARNPYVTDLGQDSTRRVPLDQIVVARRGDDFGFPRCVRFRANECGRFAKPLVTLPRHASPMGIGAIGETLYVALFSGLQAERPVVVSLPVDGGAPTPFLSGFVAPIVGLATHEGNVWVGDLTGSVYRVAATAPAG